MPASTWKRYPACPLTEAVPVTTARFPSITSRVTAAAVTRVPTLSSKLRWPEGADARGRARVRGLAQIVVSDSHPLIVPRVREFLGT